ncbi:TRAP transporter small permease [uncultured Peptoniphilus sp.]|uniref:TRAP transporter small permease n=1 Tax=uncultured Peptoniphilus sp. TaxID=254354 RepID=UPI00280464A0|nr:TRAP transporter small permease [uncultured Peptoniphilus sp.]
MKIIKWLDDYFEEVLLVFLLAFTTILTFTQVVMRYVFHNSLSWSEELARYIFLYLIWVGAAYAVKKEQHLRIEVILNKISKVNKNKFELFIYLIWLGFSLFLFISSLKMTINIFASGQLSPAMRIPIGYAYVSIPFGVGLMCFRIIQKMIIVRRSGL